MKVFIKEYNISTSKQLQVIDVTDKVEEAVSESRVSKGFAVIHVPHATAAIIINEYEPHIVEDYLTIIKELFRPGHPWRHNIIDSNAHAHLASVFLGSSKILPLWNGRLVRGTWQNIMLVELDGPRSRRLIVEVLGE
ncbi:MAG: secondary thiamine-phosphate synthase enzyme YjbQ [Pyrodictiaceae archaeon]